MQHTQRPTATSALFTTSSSTYLPFEKHCNVSLGHKWVSLGSVQVGRGRGMGGMGSSRAVMQDGSARAAGIYSSHQLLCQAFILRTSCYAKNLFLVTVATPGIYS